MEIKVSSNTMSITGNIKSISDFQEMKNSLEQMKSSSTNIRIEIVDSISVTSSVIGYLNKLVLKDKTKLSVKVGNKQLMELFEDLNLVQTLNVTGM